MYRDSPYNRNYTVHHAMVNGTIINCEYMYYEMQTELPMFFWSRFEEGSDAGTPM
jgi:hypothetical protein